MIGGNHGAAWQLRWFPFVPDKGDEIRGNVDLQGAAWSFGVDGLSELQNVGYSPADGSPNKTPQITASPSSAFNQPQLSKTCILYTHFSGFEGFILVQGSK
jgi:hypothetical protein